MILLLPTDERTTSNSVGTKGDIQLSQKIEDIQVRLTFEVLMRYR